MLTSVTYAGAEAKTGPANAIMRVNAAAATTAAGAGAQKCDFCDRVGMPILPLRYAVMPNFVTGMGDPVGYMRLGRHLSQSDLKAHVYVLRTLRKGYLMVYMGSGVWHGYAVSQEGYLRKIADPDDPDAKGDRGMSIACKRSGHNLPASFINIPLLTKGGKRALPSTIWIALSEVLWTRKTRQQYEGTDSGAIAYRFERMQEFAVDQLSTQAESVADALPLSNNIADILSATVVEFASNSTVAAKRSKYNAFDPVEPAKLRQTQWESAHGLYPRTGDAPRLVKHAAQWKEASPDGSMASAVVLNDPLGMVQELNKTRLEALETRTRYFADERIARPLLISQTIMGVKQLVQKQSAAELIDEEKLHNEPDVQTHVFRQPPRSTGKHVEVTEKSTRKERAEERSSSLWRSLQGHYRESERAAFEYKAAAMTKRLTEYIGRSNADYAHWLDRREWVLCGRDFSAESRDHQDRLKMSFCLSLLGGPTSAPADAPPDMDPVDTEIYNVWKRFVAMKPTDETNPIYVALFGHKPEILEYLLPDGVNPLTDNPHKVSKLYKVIKTLVGTKELTSSTWKDFEFEGTLSREATSKVPNPLRQGGAMALDRARTLAAYVLTLGSLASRLAENGIVEENRAAVLRAIQGAVLLYEDTEIVLMTSQIKLRDYLSALNDAAFRKAVDGASGLVSNITGRAVQVLKTDKVRSMVLAGTMSLKMNGDTLIEVTHWACGKTDAFTKDLDKVLTQRGFSMGAPRGEAVIAAPEALVASTIRVHPFNLSPRAAEFVKLVSEHAQTIRLSSAETFRSISSTSWRFVGTGSGFLAAGSVVMQGWSLWNSIKQAESAFVGSNESRLQVLSGSIAAFGAITEAVGVAGKLSGEEFVEWGGRVGRLGSAIGALSSIVDGIQALAAAYRVGTHGDVDASRLYALAASAFFVGGSLGFYAGLTGASLLGPVGLSVFLTVVVGLTLLYFAARAEDSLLEIWLDRCYWGNGSRFANGGNPTERPWGEKEVNEELRFLNALVMGLSAEIAFGFNFSVGYFVWYRVRAKITVPKNSSLEWRFWAVNEASKYRVTLSGGKFNNFQGPLCTAFQPDRLPYSNPDQVQYFGNVVTTERGVDSNLVAVEISAEVLTKYFEGIELAVYYVEDMEDPAAGGSLLLNQTAPAIG